jgi:hypothetical protein
MQPREPLGVATELRLRSHIQLRALRPHRGPVRGQRHIRWLPLLGNRMPALDDDLRRHAVLSEQVSGRDRHVLQMGVEENGVAASVRGTSRPGTRRRSSFATWYGLSGRIRRRAAPGTFR